MALAGCDTDGTPAVVNGRHMQPLSERLIADFEAKNMEKESAILVRIFKQESELEVWKEDKTGRFALLRTYPICRWSGDLGPKIKQGDRQAPEGFYPITPGQMNPNSNYYLAINTGFPNAYDRANGRSGDFLMIHGDCSSRGCYAMTDEQIGEIYALAREAFFGGQKAFQVQAFPFRMTPANMAKHRNSPHMAFWKMIKQGYDHFEVTRLEPKVDVCEKHYVFNASSSSKFSAAERCPAYSVPDDIMAAVREKTRRDEEKTAELINRGVPAAPAAMGVDGAMNPVFLSAVKSHGGPGSEIKTAYGTIPAHANPPAEPETTTGSFGFLSLASSDSKPAPAPKSNSNVQVASAAPASSGGIGGFFSNLFGSKGDDQSAETKPPPIVGTPKTKPAAKPASTAVAVAVAKPKIDSKSEPRPAETKTANAAPVAPKPTAAAPRQEANAEAESKPAGNNGLMNGAAPTVSSDAFGGRFGAWH
jgi:murein L,D-transpeptidase YafK